MTEEFKPLTMSEAVSKLNEQLDELSMSLPFVEDVDVVNIATDALKELQEYRKIVTVDECRAAVEKQKPKKPIKNRKQEIRYTSAYSCPNCGRSFTGTGIAKYCYHCGQALDWSDWSDKDV